MGKIIKNTAYILLTISFILNCIFLADFLKQGKENSSSVRRYYLKNKTDKKIDSVIIRYKDTSYYLTLKNFKPNSELSGETYFSIHNPGDIYIAYTYNNKYMELAPYGNTVYDAVIPGRRHKVIITDIDDEGHVKAHSNLYFGNSELNSRDYKRK